MPAFIEANVVRRPVGTAGAGQFAEKPRSSAEVTLEATPGPAEVLAQWELAAEELPGFVEAWHARFEGLDDAEPTEHVGDVLAELLNLEHLNLTVLDASVAVEHDRVFADIVIASHEGQDGVTTIRRDLAAEGMGVEQLRRAVAAQAQRERHAELTKQRQLRDDLTLGYTPPWHLLADPVELARAANEASAARGAEQAARAQATAAAEFERMRTALFAGGDIDRDYLIDGPHIRTPMTMGQAADTLAEARDAEEGYLQATQALREAEAMPPGPERDALLSPWSGQGLGIAQRRALARVAEANHDVERLQRVLTAAGAQYEPALEDLAAAVERTDIAIARWWQLGAPPSLTLPAAPVPEERG
ncbi:MAG TPA: hypothetical protein VL043_04960 [Protaetiibacter sp.]|nr:hypothetical protein [Protaetiibacter sp.]